MQECRTMRKVSVKTVAMRFRGQKASVFSLIVVGQHSHVFAILPYYYPQCYKPNARATVPRRLVPAHCPHRSSLHD